MTADANERAEQDLGLALKLFEDYRIISTL